MAAADISDCWTWKAVSTTGYGYSGKQPAHRAVWEALVGPIPPGMSLDHLCRNRPCVNPDHLRVVSMRDNTLASPITITGINARKTHCVNGHPFDADNTYTPPNRPNRRECRECVRTRSREWQRAHHGV